MLPSTMQFFARLNPRSSIHQDWRMHHRLGGLLNHVQFTLDHETRTYVSGALTQAQVDGFRVRADQAVQLEAVGVLPDDEPQQASTAVVDEKPARSKRVRLSG